MQILKRKRALYFTKLSLVDDWTGKWINYKHLWVLQFCSPKVQEDTQMNDVKNITSFGHSLY